jgi:hypothetical protein
MLCGAPPFVSEGFGDIIIMHVMRPPDPPQAKNPAIPDGVAAAMLCALSKEPADRFQSMGEFQAALRSLTTAPHAMPFAMQPSAVRTAVLEGQEVAAQRPVMPFDRTMATPPPVALGRAPSRPPWGAMVTPPPVAPGRAPSRPPSHVSTMFDPSASGSPPSTTKQSTTFRNASGEMAATNVNLRGKRNTIVAVAAVVALAAAGLVITLLVTRPGPKPQTVEVAAPTAAPDPTPPPSPLPPPQAEPIHEIEPPPSTPPTNTVEPERQAGPDHKSTRKPSNGKSRRPDRPTEQPTPPPVADPGSKQKPDTERW